MKEPVRKLSFLQSSMADQNISKQKVHDLLKQSSQSFQNFSQTTRSNKSFATSILRKSNRNSLKSNKNLIKFKIDTKKCKILEQNQYYLSNVEDAVIKFKELSIKKNMPNKELLGIILRDDKLLNELGCSQEEIRQIWNKEVG